MMDSALHLVYARASLTTKQWIIDDNFETITLTHKSAVAGEPGEWRET
jgi:hypothetical protein